MKIRGNCFDINTVGANSNLCQIDGRCQRQGNRAFFEDDDGCEVRFRFERNRVTLPPPKAPPPPAATIIAAITLFLPANTAACTAQGIKNSEQRFQVAYRAGRFNEAARIQQHSLNRCEDFMCFIDRMSACNNLAAAHKNTSDQAACRRTLQPFADEIDGQSDFIAPAIWRSEYENALKAARFNWQLRAPH